MPSDLKEGLSSARKPDLTHVRRVLMTYIARACEYGSERYQRANFLRPVAGPYDGTPKPADFERLRSYLRALQSHVTLALDALELHQSTDFALENAEGMKKAAFAEDTDEPPTGSKVGASHLPHLAHAGASLMMALVQATLCGLMPDDPGVTWRNRPMTIAKDERKAFPPCAVWRDSIQCRLPDHHAAEHNFGCRCPKHLSNAQCYLTDSHAGDCYFGNPL